MGVAQLPGRVLKGSAGDRGDPERPQELEPWQTPFVALRVPLLQFGACIHDLRVLQELVAEVVHHRGNRIDAPEAFVERRFWHALPPITSVIGINTPYLWVSTLIVDPPTSTRDLEELPVPEHAPPPGEGRQDLRAHDPGVLRRGLVERVVRHARPGISVRD